MQITIGFEVLGDLAAPGVFLQGSRDFRLATPSEQSWNDDRSSEREGLTTMLATNPLPAHIRISDPRHACDLGTGERRACAVIAARRMAERVNSEGNLRCSVRRLRSLKRCVTKFVRSAR
jgi:hypothetical protein